jgi:quercetin dioxygenase-like cupin family protein
MALPGQQITNPEFGERMRFIKTGSDTGGALLETEEWLLPGGAVATKHVHPEQEERFTVLAGSLRVEVGRGERVLGPGEAVMIAPGVAHRFSNIGEGEMHFIGEVRPALRTEELFGRMAAIAEREDATPTNRVGLLTMAPLFLRYAPGGSSAALPALASAIRPGTLGRFGSVAGTRCGSATLPLRRRPMTQAEKKESKCISR